MTNIVQGGRLGLPFPMPVDIIRVVTCVHSEEGEGLTGVSTVEQASTWKLASWATPVFE